MVGEVGGIVELPAEAVRADSGGVVLVDVAQGVLERRVPALLLADGVVAPPVLGLPLHEDRSCMYTI